ncbi:ferredoxin-NADP reductase [Kibdelosporangium banguiense]|uniref:Ferredoxin-NADP reductase n=1 Tax=Kibdelosporangium banguiense TaxID=1365924 RepID=A0ABS4TYD2_9PSEU|nr:hypothetical protein [Kibdelosporangium banguiense]MBP2329376.1 ferredoxin-NADP reductase [Kibdelosporangium banguiense]
MIMAAIPMAVARNVELVVTAKTVVADGVVSLTLAHREGRRMPDWTPGAHIDLVLPNGLTLYRSKSHRAWSGATVKPLGS